MDSSKISINKNEIFKEGCLIGISCILSWLFLLISPLHPFVKGTPGIDSSVFQTIAMMMNRGYVPYKDSFDHKGPLLYVLEWIGYNISKTNGIFYVELIFLAISVFFLYKTSRLMCSAISSGVIVLISLVEYMGYFQGGNLTEEFALPFITISIYIFLQFFLFGTITNLNLIICGFCFTGTFLLRPNMIVIWITFCLGVLVMSLQSKNWNALKRYVLYFLIGVFIIMIPIAIWLITSGNFVSCFDAFILFNQKYAANTLFEKKWEAFLYFGKSFLYISSAIWLILFSKKSRLYVHIFYFFAMLLTLVSVAMSGFNYDHYGIIMIPLIVYPFSQLFSWIEKELKKEKRLLFLIISILVLIGGFGLFHQRIITKIENSITKIDQRRKKDEVVEEIGNIIIQNVDEEEYISVYGNWDVIYLESDRKHATRYSYQFPIGKIDSLIMDDYYIQLEEEMPKAIVVSRNHFDERMEGFLLQNDYERIWPEVINDNKEAQIFLKKN